MCIKMNCLFDFARSTQPQNRKVSQDADFKMYVQYLGLYTHRYTYL